MTDSKEFLGLPVQGDVNNWNTRRTQRTIEEFAPSLQAVLDDPTIIEFGWEQYTPHFNDGDACIFSVHYPIWFRTTADKDVDDLYSLDIDENHPSLGKMSYTYDAHTHKRIGKTYEGPDEARFNRCSELQTALLSGEFDDVLQNAFGDHAEITVRKDYISIESCSHD
jgi:hypothetical protein